MRLCRVAAIVDVERCATAIASTGNDQIRKRLANTFATVAIKAREHADHLSFPLGEVVSHRRIVPAAARSEQVPSGRYGALVEQPGRTALALATLWDPVASIVVWGSPCRLRAGANRQRRARSRTSIGPSGPRPHDSLGC